MFKNGVVEVRIDVLHEIGKLQGRNVFGSETEMFFTQKPAIPYFAYIPDNRVF